MRSWDLFTLERWSWLANLQGMQFLIAVGTVLLVYALTKFFKRQLVQMRLIAKRKAKRNQCMKSLQQLEHDCSTNTPEESQKIVQLSLRELTTKLQSNELLPTEVIHAFQGKAIEENKTLNCLVENIKEANDRAKDLEQIGVKRGLLYGVPVSIKDNFGIKGYDSSVGCSRFIDKPYTKDAVLVQVLKSQGAIPFVKTNVPQTMLSWETTNPIFGATRNPHDTSRGVGGSSGGEASLIAAGGSILGFGSDIGGSIRIPANMCGIYGLKPTENRISNKGTVPILKGQTCIGAAYGPMARDVDSLALAMRALCVPKMSELDPFVPYIPFKTDVYESKQKLKIGYFLDDGFFSAVPAMQRGVLVAKAALESVGHEVVLWTYPELGDKVVYTWANALMGDGSEEMNELLYGDGLDSAMKSLMMLNYLPKTLRKVLSIPLSFIYPSMATFVKASVGLKSVAKWWGLMHETAEFRKLVVEDWQAKGFDVVLCPGFGCPAVPLEMAGYCTGAASYTMLYNMLNFPSGSLPVTRVTSADNDKLKDYPLKDLWHRTVKHCMSGSEGLPVNIQVAALPWQEELVLRVMSEIEAVVKFKFS